MLHRVETTCAVVMLYTIRTHHNVSIIPEKTLDPRALFIQKCKCKTERAMAMQTAVCVHVCECVFVGECV